MTKESKAKLLAFAIELKALLAKHDATIASNDDLDIHIGDGRLGGGASHFFDQSHISGDFTIPKDLQP